MVRRRTIEEELESCPELRLEDVHALRDWAKKQPHLPNIDAFSDVFLALFLRRRYFSLERAKETLDNLLTFMTIVPEMMGNRSITRPEIKEALASQHVALLDQKDSNGHIIFFHVVHDPDANKYDYNATVKIHSMIAESWVLENGGANGVTFIFDQRALSFGHLLRLSPIGLKKANYFNKECSPISVKKVFILNATPIVQKLLALFEPLLDDVKKINVFKPSETEELYKYIPKEIVPKDYGGDAETMDELHKKSIQLLERYEEHFKAVNELKVDESKRIGPEKNMNTMFGLEGTFKQLNVD